MSPKSYTKIYSEVAVTLYLLLPFLEGKVKTQTFTVHLSS